MALARQTPGFEKVKLSQVKQWTEAKPSKKMGRPVNEEFEKAVLDNLVFTELVQKESANEVAIVANAAYSYPTIKQAAIMTQTEEVRTGLRMTLRFRTLLSRTNGFKAGSVASACAAAA